MMLSEQSKAADNAAELAAKLAALDTDELAGVIASVLACRKDAVSQQRNSFTLSELTEAIQAEEERIFSDNNEANKILSIVTSSVSGRVKTASLYEKTLILVLAAYMQGYKVAMFMYNEYLQEQEKRESK